VYTVVIVTVVMDFLACRTVEATPVVLRLTVTLLFRASNL
jgi:hypothetical protein